MNQRFFIMLVIASLLAGGAAWMAKRWVNSVTGQTAEPDEIPIVVAAIDIAYGAKIEPTQLKMAQWSANHIPKGAFTDTKLVVGKIAQRSFITDEVLLEPQVKEKLVGSVLSALIPEGNRAMSVRVDDIAGVAGFITPGNMVDIIATKNNRTYILLSNVKVLAIDQLASPEQDKPAVVRALTLEVSVPQSTLLVKAMREGPLYFTLRNPLDKQNTAARFSAVDDPVIAPVSSGEKTAVIAPSVKPPVKPHLKIIDWPTSGKSQTIDNTDKNENKDGTK